MKKLQGATRATLKICDLLTSVLGEHMLFTMDVFLYQLRKACVFFNELLAGEESYSDKERLFS